MLPEETLKSLQLDYKKWLDRFVDSPHVPEYLKLEAVELEYKLMAEQLPTQ